MALSRRLQQGNGDVSERHVHMRANHCPDVGYGDLMVNIDRPQVPNPYDLLPAPATFRVTSDDLRPGETVPLDQVAAGAGGGDISPQLAWSGAPEGTVEYAITCFDPDAPTVSGYWHWLLVGLPADVTVLARGASHGDLPQGAVELGNDAGTSGYTGAAPPPGDRSHRYLFAVHALGERLGLHADEPSGGASFAITAAELGRAVLEVTYSRAADA